MLGKFKNIFNKGKESVDVVKKESKPKSNSKKETKEEDSKADKENKDEIKGFAGTQVMIQVWRDIGNGLLAEINSFEAIQKKDKNDVMTYENLAKNFKEDVEVITHESVRDYETKLNLSEKTTEEKVKKIKELIKAQRTKLEDAKSQSASKEVEVLTPDQALTKKRINLIDEKVNLKVLEIALYLARRGSVGTCERINKAGQKLVEYQYLDGLLFPLFYDPITQSLYSAIGSAKKIYKSQDDKIERDYMLENKNFYKDWKFALAMVSLVILFLTNIFWSNANMQARADMDETLDEYRLKAEGGAINCAYFYSKVIEGDMSLIARGEKAIDEDRLKAEEEAQKKQVEDNLVMDRINNIGGN